MGERCDARVRGPSSSGRGPGGTEKVTFSWEVKGQSVLAGGGGRAGSAR